MQLYLNKLNDYFLKRFFIPISNTKYIKFFFNKITNKL